MNRIYLACDDSIPRIDGYDPYCDVYLCAQSDASGCVYVTFPYTSGCSVTDTRYYVHKNSYGYYVDVPDCCLDTCGCEDINTLGYYPVLDLTNFGICQDFDDTYCFFLGASCLTSISSNPIQSLTSYSSSDDTLCNWTGERTGTAAHNGTDYDWKMTFSVAVSSWEDTEDSNTLCGLAFILGISFSYRESGDPTWIDFTFGGFQYNQNNHATHCSGPKFKGLYSLIGTTADSAITCYNHSYPNSTSCTPPGCTPDNCEYICNGTVSLYWSHT